MRALLVCVTTAVATLVLLLLASSGRATLRSLLPSARRKHPFEGVNLLELAQAEAASSSLSVKHPPRTLESFLGSGGNVVALVFAGRRRYLSILWPYLLRERRRGSDHGVLSQVVFAARTDDVDDLSFLDALERAHPDFVQVRKLRRGPEDKIKPFCELYATELLWSSNTSSVKPPLQDTLVIKLDDDIVFMAPYALHNLAAAKLAHSSWLFVSANVVNHPLLSWVHQCVHTSAVCMLALLFSVTLTKLTSAYSPQAFRSVRA